MGYGLDPTGCIEREDFLELLRRGKAAGALKEARRRIMTAHDLQTRSKGICSYIYILSYIYFQIYVV